MILQLLRGQYYPMMVIETLSQLYRTNYPTQEGFPNFATLESRVSRGEYKNREDFIEQLKQIIKRFYMTFQANQSYATLAYQFDCFLASIASMPNENLQLTLQQFQMMQYQQMMQRQPVQPNSAEMQAHTYQQPTQFAPSSMPNQGYVSSPNSYPMMKNKEFKTV